MAVEDVEEAGHGAPGEAVGGDEVGVAAVGEEVLREGGRDFVGMKRAWRPGRAEAESAPDVRGFFVDDFCWHGVCYKAGG